MNQQEIISLLDEAIQVLVELQANRRKADAEEAKVFHVLRTLCQGKIRDAKRRRLLGKYLESVHHCVALACAGEIDHRAVQQALSNVIQRNSDVTILPPLESFLRRLRHEISVYELLSMDEMIAFFRTRQDSSIPSLSL